MLDAKDLEAISAIVHGEIRQSEERMDKKLGALEERMDKKLDALEERMDKKLDALEERMDKKLDSLEARMDKKMDQKLVKQEKRMLAIVDKRIAKSENLVLGELDRIHIQMSTRMDKVEKRLDSIEQFYRSERLTNDTVTMVINKVEDLYGRVADLEKVVYA